LQPSPKRRSGRRLAPNRIPAPWRLIMRL
jgi:hypothetical protein